MARHRVGYSREVTRYEPSPKYHGFKVYESIIICITWWLGKLTANGVDLVLAQNLGSFGINPRSLKAAMGFIAAQGDFFRKGRVF